MTQVERHGFIKRQHRSDDRRIVECVLTDAGSQFLDELTNVRIDAIRTALAKLTPRELSGFRVLLARIGARQGEPA